MTQIWLAVGSTSLADAVCLTAVAPSGGGNCFVRQGGLQLAPLDPSKPERVITLQLVIDGVTSDAYLSTIRAIRRKLEQAARSVGGGDAWVGTPVCLWMLLGNASNYVYWDVTGGTLTQAADYGDRAGLWTLSLTVLPYARGPIISEGANVVANGGGEFDTSGWSTTAPAAHIATGGTLTRDTTTALYGTASLKLVTTNAAGNEGMAYALPTLTTGQAYIASVWLKGSGTLQLELGDMAGSIAATAGLVLTSTWTQYTLTWTASAAAAYVILRTMTASVVTANVDGVKVETGSVATRYAEVLTNGNSGIWLPNVPGDTDALCRLTLTDVSTGGVVINRVRLGRRSLPGMAQTDFAPVAHAVAATETLPTMYVLSLGGATAGTFTLSFGGQTTSAQAFNVPPVTLQSALTGLSSIGAGNATVSGTGAVLTPFQIPFAGSLAAAQQGNITIASSLTGGTGAVLTRVGSATFSDATALGGTTTRLMAVNGYRSVGQATGASTGLQPGHYDLWARVRDNTTVLGKPSITSVTVTTGGDGTLAFSTVIFQVTEIDASGGETLPSDPVTATLNNSAPAATVAWTAVGAPTSFRLYFKQGANVWKYFTVSGSAVSAAITTSTGATTANPPAQATSATTIQLLPLAALDAPSPQYVLGRATTAMLGNGQWEMVYIGTVMLPPMPEWENQSTANPSWRVLLQSQLGSSTATPATIDFDYLLLMPHEEPQLRAEYTAQNLATARTWVIDTRRDGRSSAVLTDTSGTVQGQANKVGQFTLGPGSNLIVVDVSVAGSVHDVVNAKYSVRVEYVPRYADPIGLVQ